MVSGSTNPITVSATQVTLSDGPASGPAGMVVEAYASHSRPQTSAAAARSRGSGGPAGLAASSADGYLSLFNLTGAAMSQQAITVPQDGKLLLYRGNQSVVSGGTSYEVSLAAATGRENVIAGADCGFSSQATYKPEIHPSVVWARCAP